MIKLRIAETKKTVNEFRFLWSTSDCKCILSCSIHEFWKFKWNLHQFGYFSGHKWMHRLILSQSFHKWRNTLKFSRHLYLLLLGVSTCEFQHFVTTMIRKENMMSFCITIYKWDILKLVLITLRMAEFSITYNLVLSIKITSYSVFWS